MGLYAEYHKAVQARNEIISQNRRRRMYREPLPPLPVPAKPARPLVPVVYEADGTYCGRVDDPEEAALVAQDIGGTVKMEPATW